jgi:hypothetical protein
MTAQGKINASQVERAHAEALIQDAARSRRIADALVAQAEMDEATANQATPQYRYFAEATRVAGGYAGGMRALEIEAHAEHADRNWARLSRNRAAEAAAARETEQDRGAWYDQN